MHFNIHFAHLSVIWITMLNGYVCTCVFVYFILYEDVYNAIKNLNDFMHLEEYLHVWLCINKIQKKIWISFVH